MTVTTPAAAHSATGNPPSAGANRPSMTANLPSMTASKPLNDRQPPLHAPSKPSTGADRTGWFGAMTKKNAI